MIISTTNGTDWSPVNSDSESDVTPPATPRVSARQQSGPSLLDRVSAFFKTEEKAEPKDNRPDQVVNKVFSDFLEQKTQNGGKFTLRERFNYNCREYIDAKGFAKFKAFVKIGGFGAIAAGKFTAEQKTDLKKQFEFHRAMTLATDCFNRFANPSILSRSPTRADFERAKTAFEAVLDNAKEHTLTNQIMNKVTGKQVSNTLVEAEARYQLTEGGKVTPDTILNTFNSQSFLDQIDTFRANGYRPEMSEVEVAKVDDYDAVTTGNVAFDKLINDTDRVPFYMAYARVYNKIYNDALPDMARMHRQTTRSLQAPSKGQVDEAIEENNEKLFALIKANPKGAVELPLGVDQHVFGEMAQLYRQYADQQVALVPLKEKQGELQTKFVAAKTTFDNFSENMGLNYEQLSKVYGEDVDQTLPGATPFLKLRGEIDQANQQATQTSAEIAARKKQLEDELNQVRGEKARLEGELSTSDVNLNSLARRFEESQKIINPYEEFEDQSVEQIKTEQKQKLEEYRATKKAISSASLSIVRISHELTSINDNTHDLCQRLQETNKLRQALIQRKVKLEPEQVAELSDKTRHVLVGRLMTEYQEKEMAFKAVETLVVQNDQKLKTVLGQLVEIAETMEARGFIFERDNVTGIEYPAFKSAQYAAKLKQHLIDAGETTRMLVVQMRQLNKSDDELNAEEAANALKAKEVVAPPVVKKPEVNGPNIFADEADKKPALVPQPALVPPPSIETLFNNNNNTSN